MEGNDMSESQPLVLYRVEDKVAVVTLNRPEKLNALNRELWAQIDAAFARAEEDVEVRTIVLEGSGRAFCAGGDASAGEDPSGLLRWWEHYERHHARQFRMWSSSKAIIAAVHGYCLGGGVELALWCDIVVASEDARLGHPEIRGGAVLYSVVPWLTGPQQAKLFMLSGDVIGAREAERLGLVARVVEAGAVRSEALKLAKRLSRVPPVAARAVKQMINGLYDQMGIRAQQAAGIAVSAMVNGMTPIEKGTEEIERVRRKEGFKTSLRVRDAGFEV
jgi:enoyl-CoA hydratase